MQHMQQGGGMGGMGGMGYPGMGMGFPGMGMGMGMNMGNMGQQSQQGDPKEIYKDQLEQLKNMGFTNETVNI